MAKEKAYPVHVCTRLDRLSEARVTEIAREESLKKKRKAAQQAFAKIGWGSTPEHKELALDLVQILFEIDHCRGRQKSLSEKIDEVIANAHQGDLFDNEDLDNLTGRQSIDQVVKSFARQPAAEPEDPDQQQLPVGGPNAGKPADPPPAPLQFAGVDEHLQASVNELDMREDLKGKCIQAECPTIGHLATLLDSPGRADLRDKLNVGEKQAAEIAKAVKAFRAKHRDAMRKAETA
ncbi:MAG: hypothetical protein IT435_20670 [Phycisphaerales bacterium]|nr:hypothetical protein [Phycisphaerales bacterium]